MKELTILTDFDDSNVYVKFRSAGCAFSESEFKRIDAHSSMHDCLSDSDNNPNNLKFGLVIARNLLGKNNSTCMLKSEADEGIEIVVMIPRAR